MRDPCQYTCSSEGGALSSLMKHRAAVRLCVVGHDVADDSMTYSVFRVEPLHHHARQPNRIHPSSCPSIRPREIVFLRSSLDEDSKTLHVLLVLWGGGGENLSLQQEESDT